VSKPACWVSTSLAARDVRGEGEAGEEDKVGKSAADMVLLIRGRMGRRESSGLDFLFSFSGLLGAERSSTSTLFIAAA